MNGYLVYATTVTFFTFVTCQAKELHRTVRSVGLRVKNKKAELLSAGHCLGGHKERTLGLFWYLCWEQNRNFCCWQLLLGEEQWSSLCGWHTSESFSLSLSAAPSLLLWGRGQEGGSVFVRIQVTLWRVAFDPYYHCSQQGAGRGRERYPY